MLDPPKTVRCCAGIFIIIPYYTIFSAELGRNRTYFADFFGGGRFCHVFSVFSSEVSWEIDDIYLDVYGFFEPTADFVEVQALCRGEREIWVCCQKMGPSDMAFGMRAQ